ncbi:MAG: molybdopterin molybdotransferase MoeA [Candidatus Heimdallarchaeota archaeon]
MERRDLRRTFKLIPHEEALRRLMRVVPVKPIGYEEVALERSTGRVLAEDIVSKVNIPDQRRAVFDGYAIRSADIQNASLETPVTLKIVGKTFSGGLRCEMASSGEAVYTACGATVPDNADAVIKVENTRLLEDRIQILSPVKLNQNITRIGEDVKKGGLILKKGYPLRPQDVGLLAGIGMSSVKVFKKPRVGIISVGDELVESGRKRKIANNYALIASALVSELGGSPKLLGVAPDDINQIKGIISKAVREMDIVATIAGCSVGVKDLVPDAIEALGGKIVFHGVKLSPGSPMGVGTVKGKRVIMLPGYIASAYAAFYLLLAPIIAMLSGLAVKSSLPTIKAKITHDVKAKPVATFLRVRLKRINGEFLAEPVRGGSSHLSTLVNSNGHTIVPAGEGLNEGEAVDVILYGRHEFPRLTPY